MVCFHAAAIAAYLLVRQPPKEEIGNETPVISIDLNAPQIDQVQQEKVDKQLNLTVPIRFSLR